MEKEIKQTVISEENYDNIKTMLLSNDESSVMMAFSILEGSEFSSSQVFIATMLCETYSKVLTDKKANFLEESYPELNKNLYDLCKGLNVDEGMISKMSFAKTYELAKQRGNAKEIQFVINRLTNKFQSLLIDYGFAFLEYFDIKLEPKT